MGSEHRVAGADGAPGGWAVVILAGGRFERAMLVPSLPALDEAAGRLEAVGVDIPIVLAPDAASWPRRADLEARAMLGPRRHSVFLAPPEPVLECSGYGEANRRHRELTCSGMSRQAWALVGRVREARRYAARRCGVVEVHPEVSFAAMGGGAVPWPKSTWNGLRERLRRLEGAGVHLPDRLPPESSGLRPDDLLDAAAAAWSAHRVALGIAGTLGGEGGIRY